MIRHIVMWKLTSADPVERREQVSGIKERLEALVGDVPGLVRLTVSPDLGDTAGNWDVVLVSEHEDAAALDGYQVHPRHVAAASWVKTVVHARACVDVIL